MSKLYYDSEGFIMNKTKAILSIAVLISQIPMFLSWFGGGRGVQEIKGTIVLFNPITIVCILIYFMGVWEVFKKRKVNTRISVIGLGGIILVEIYEFLTWHYMTVTGRISLKTSIRMAYPEFYLGLFLSIFMLVLYLYLIRTKRLKN